MAGDAFLYPGDPSEAAGVLWVGGGGGRARIRPARYPPRAPGRWPVEGPRLNGEGQARQQVLFAADNERGQRGLEERQVPIITTGMEPWEDRCESRLPHQFGGWDECIQ